jgi:hypothetical protein
MTLELRGSARPTLQQALRWIGSRVDDIYGASIGKLEDIWMDPDSGEPLWLLVRDGRIGGRHTLVPFAQAASGAGHVWIPFEREVVRGAPAVRPSAPLSHELSDTLRRYYAESGHPVGGAARAEEAVREAAPQHASPHHAAAAEAEPREYTHAFAQPAATPSAAAGAQAPPRRPAPPPGDFSQRRESRPRQPWSAPAAPAAPPTPPDQAPLPPMPSRAPMPAQTQTRPPRRQAPGEESFTAPRQQAPRTAPPRFEPPPVPPRPDQARQASTPPPAAGRQSAPEELHITVGEGVDMELVGRLQFRGSIVRVQPLQSGAADA